ncbi:MAG TPA: hypothetical protein VMS55_02395 [Myxococcota bacterium]|nr:hypothetical protein [Myxococcota bacterium]
MPATLRPLALVGLVAGLAVSSACDDGKNVELLEAKKSEILEHTRPKQEFWDQVERKGRALKQERSASDEIASLQSKSSETRTALDSLRKQLEDARATNARASDVLSNQVAQRDAAEAEVAKNEATLASFLERQRSGAAP